MRPRAVALIILVIFLILPVFAYWYFYSSRISSIIFESETDFPYTVSLEGSLEYSYFPLLDKAFSYKSTCIKSCIFSPIPPLKYALTISGSGKEDIVDTLSLATGEESRYSVKLIPSLQFIPSGLSVPSKIPAGGGIIGTSLWGKDIFLGNLGLEEIGVYESGRSAPLFSLNFPIKKGGLDKTGLYVVFEGIRPEQYIFSLDGMRKVIFPFRESIQLVTYDSAWKILTPSGAYELRFDAWQKNPRFTDSIDISERYRIGYISREDTSKISLQNLPAGNSYFILLDRTSTESRIIKKGYDIEGFFYQEKIPSVLHKDGSISQIMISLDD